MNHHLLTIVEDIAYTVGLTVVIDDHAVLLEKANQPVYGSDNCRDVMLFLMGYKSAQPNPKFEIIEAKRNVPLVLVRENGKLKFKQKHMIDPDLLRAHQADRQVEHPVGQA